MPSYQTILHLLKHPSQPDNSRVIIAPGRPPLSFAKLTCHIEKTVDQLNVLGIGHNDPVALVLPNGPEMAVAFLAVASGATCAPLNPGYGANEFEFYLSDLKAKAIITQAGIDSPARLVAQSLQIPVIELLPDYEAEAGIFTLSGSQRATPKQGRLAEANDVALVLHTSGTTSRPKIVPLTHANLWSSAHNIQKTLALTPNDRCLNVMPLFHIHGLVGVLLSSLSAGAGVICTPGFDALKFFDWVDEFRPSWYSAVPTIHQAILDQVKVNRAIINQCQFRFVRSSSASLPRPVMAQLEDVFQSPVIEAYGMTEASHQMTSNPLPPRQCKPGSVGIAAGPEVAIMDETGDLLPTGQTGEIVIRGANVTAGYQNNPTANESAFTNGWFRTGDQGYMDEQGYLFISGRLKEIINRGGEKIAPREVDEIFLNHPAVKQAVTFAVPHHTLGEDVATAVILQDGYSIAERELRAFAFEHLTDYKVPSRVLIVDEIPKGPTGKLQRLGLADKLAGHLKAGFAAARTPAESVLCDIWQEIFEVKQVGIFDNFFGLGGDSLQATRLAARIQATFCITVPLKTIFKSPTIAEQAIFIEDVFRQEIEKLTEEEARQLLE